MSGGIMLISAHKRSSTGQLTPEDAMAYLRAQSLGYMDDELVETFVHTGADMLDFVTTMGRWHDEMLGVPKPALMRLIKLGAGVTKLINWRPGKGKDAQ